MISVAEALSKLFDLVAQLDAETVPLAQASGRVLARDVRATRDQPPFSASAMDGYAIFGTAANAGDVFTVVGEAAAGHRFTGSPHEGQACRIFTGAPIPEGAGRVIIQEDVTRQDDTIILSENLDHNPYIRPAAADFKAGDAIQASRLLTPSDIALLASMNLPEVPVTRKPTVAIIATGDELVQPGETPNDDQIIASNAHGLAALVNENGGHARVLPIARDNLPALQLTFELAKDADLIVTIGGASVGDHDLVAEAAAEFGMERAFYKIAMRPGKPLMAGKIGPAAMIGLPGNPVSSLVCGHIFILPILRKMLGLGADAAPRRSAHLAQPLDTNGGREHYMRAKVIDGQVTVFERQDSSLLTVLADANCLCVREPHAEAVDKGATVEIVDL